MSGGSRKSHSKTRRGCAQCKRRRVRCDLRPPVCSNCKRRGEQCEYMSMQLGYTMSDSGPGPSEPPHLIPTNLSNSPPGRRFSGDSLDEELEAHFIAVTSQTLGMVSPTPGPDPWQDEVPTRMQSTRFLWHGALSVSALHLSDLRPALRELYYQRACQHQSLALPLFRTEVATVSADNALEVVAFCVFVSTFNFHVAKSGVDVDVFEPLLALRSGAMLVRECLPAMQEGGGGGGSVLQNMVGSLWALPLPLLLLMPADEAAQQAAVGGLDQLSATLQAGGPHSSASLQAIALLRECFVRFSLRPTGWLHVVFWPTALSDEYVDALRGGDQSAMIVFLYWCASMDNAPKVWWLEGWCPAAGQTCLDRIDPHWESFVTWPRLQFNVPMQFPYMTAEETRLLYADAEAGFPTTQAQEFMPSSAEVMGATAPWAGTLLPPSVSRP